MKNKTSVLKSATNALSKDVKRGFRDTVKEFGPGTTSSTLKDLPLIGAGLDMILKELKKTSTKKEETTSGKSDREKDANRENQRTANKILSGVAVSLKNIDKTLVDLKKILTAQNVQSKYDSESLSAKRREALTAGTGAAAGGDPGIPGGNSLLSVLKPLATDLVKSVGGMLGTAGKAIVAGIVGKKLLDGVGKVIAAPIPTKTPSAPDPKGKQTPALFKPKPTGALEKGAGQVAKKSGMAVAGRIGAGLLRFIPVLGTIVTAATILPDLIEYLQGFETDKDEYLKLRDQERIDPTQLSGESKAKLEELKKKGMADRVPKEVRTTPRATSIQPGSAKELVQGYDDAIKSGDIQRSKDFEKELGTGGLTVDKAREYAKTGKMPATDSTLVKTPISGKGGNMDNEKLVMGALQKYGVSDKKQMDILMGQLSHESYGFTRLTESASGKKYEGRKDLGNTEEGDGERYKGRGFVQLTGRYNYRVAGKAMGLDLENNPELAAKPDVAAEIAAWYVTKYRPKAAQAALNGDIEGATKAINGGLNGLADRIARTQKYFENETNAMAMTPRMSPIAVAPNQEIAFTKTAAIGDLTSAIAELNDPTAMLMQMPSMQTQPQSSGTGSSSIDVPMPTSPGDQILQNLDSANFSTTR